MSTDQNTMMDTQLDMTVFHELLWDENIEDQPIAILRELLVVEEPNSVAEAIGELSFGVWSGWSM